MRLTREHQADLQRRARRLGSVVPRGTELAGGYAGGIVLFVREPVPLWDVVLGAAGGFVILFSYVLTLLRASSGAEESRIRDWSRELLDRVPGWRRLDDVALCGADADHVIATPVGLLVVVTKWRIGMRDGQTRRRRHHSDLALAAAAARGIRRLSSLPPNAMDVPVTAALLLWGPGNGAVTTGWNQAQGVYVLDANQPWAWPRELTAQGADESTCREAEVVEALRKVRGWAAHHERRLSRRRLAVILLGEVRRGLGDRRSHRGRSDDRVVERALLGHGH
jgi:hypothetical protein